MLLRLKMVSQVEEGFQVPPSMVRSIVITVLQSQVLLCRQDTFHACVLSYDPYVHTFPFQILPVPGRDKSY